MLLGLITLFCNNRPKGYSYAYDEHDRGERWDGQAWRADKRLGFPGFGRLP